MDIILSTRNPSKLFQIADIFKDSDLHIVSLAEAGIEGDVIEDGTTLAENALKKARFAYECAGKGVWTMADDTGLFIKALDGAPGIYSARWAGEDATTEEIALYTLKRIEGVVDRSAYFETVVALIAPDGHEYFFMGKIEGTLLESPRVTPQPKMPYSHLFVPVWDTRSWAEMPVEDENLVSHRGKAFQSVKEFLKKEVLQKTVDI